jgi:hypothetical protein
MSTMHDMLSVTKGFQYVCFFPLPADKVTTADSYKPLGSNVMQHAILVPAHSYW